MNNKCSVFIFFFCLTITGQDRVQDSSLDTFKLRKPVMNQFYTRCKNRKIRNYDFPHNFFTQIFKFPSENRKKNKN